MKIVEIVDSRNFTEPPKICCACIENPVVISAQIILLFENAQMYIVCHFFRKTSDFDLSDF